MSRLRARVSLGVALLFLVPTPQAAQTAPVSNAQQDLLLEIDSLIEQAQQAEERLRRTREHHLAVTREVDATALDTVTVASLRIVTPPDQVELATELFSEVMSEQFRSRTSRRARRCMVSLPVERAARAARDCRLALPG